MIGIHGERGDVSVVFDDRPDKPECILEASRFEADKTITAAAEIGRGLFLATEGGSVSTYTKKDNKPWRWDAVSGPEARTGPIRDLLVPEKTNDRMVAVGDKNVLIQRRSENDPWEVSHALLEGNGPVEGEVTRDFFYGRVLNPLEDGPMILKTAYTGRGAPETVVGAPFPSRLETAAIGITSGRNPTIFRTDRSGEAASYDLQSHGWAGVEDLSGVDHFFSVDDRLWGWSKQNGLLTKHTGKGWEPDRRRWGQAASDGKALLMTAEEGDVVLRDSRNDRVAIPPNPALPLQSPNDIEALAQIGPTLFLALKDGRLVSYDRVTHMWKDDWRDPNHVKKFERIAGAQDALFALTKEGELFRYDTGGRNWSDVRDPEDSDMAFTSVENAGDRLAGVTRIGHVLFFDHRGRIDASHRPRLLKGEKDDSFHLVAAAEVNGCLHLVPDSSDSGNRLWVYDPAVHSWKEHDLDGPGISFLRSKDSTWLAVGSSGDEIDLIRMKGDPPEPGIEKGPFLDATSDGEQLFVVTRDKRLSKLNRDGSLSPAPVADASLPEGREVFRVQPVGNDLAVLLDDGSVYHYTKERKWIEKFPTLRERGPIPGKFIVDEKGTYFLRPPNIDIYKYDPLTGEWTERLEENRQEGDAVFTEAPPTKPEGPAWKVVRRDPPVYGFTVDWEPSPLALNLEGSRFDLDMVVKSALRENVLWLKTPAAVRRYERDQDRWREETADVGDFPADKPDPLKFEGEVFSARRAADGPFAAVSGEPVRLTMKLGGEEIALRPAHNEAGAGFAHDVVRGAAFTEEQGLLATAGGAVLLEMQGSSVKVAGVEGRPHGLEDEDLVRILARKDAFIALSANGRYMQRHLTQAGWKGIGEKEGTDAFAEADSIERADAMLDDWKVARSENGTTLEIDLGEAGRKPVTLTASGFGFDRPKGLALGDDEMRLYTHDGLVSLSRKDIPGPVTALDERFALPPELTSYADVFEEPGQGGPSEVWLDSPSGKRRYGNGTWSVVTPERLADYLRENRPYWRLHGYRWDREDNLSIEKGPCEGAVIRFDPSIGRFDVDRPYETAVFDDDLWSVTPGGVVRFGKDNHWKGLMLTGGGEPFEDSASIKVVRHRDGRVMVLQSGGKLLRWNGKEWGPPADPGSLQSSVLWSDAHLLDGDYWRLSRSEAKKAPFAMHARLVKDGELEKVLLLEDGRFDFESVNAALEDGLECHVASRFGTAKVHTTSKEFLDLQGTEKEPVRLGVLRGERYALLSDSREMVLLDDDWRLYAKNDAFSQIDQWIIDESPWRWKRTQGGLSIRLEPESDVWLGREALDVKIVDGRFGFDTVTDVGVKKQPYLASGAGLLVRQGSDWEQFGMESNDLLEEYNGGGRRLFSVLLDEGRRLCARGKTGLLMFEDGAWKSVSHESGRLIEELAETKTAGNEFYDVRKDAGGRLSISVHTPEDKEGIYNKTTFDDGEGRFTFDVLKALTRKADIWGGAVYAATQGGVLSFSLVNEDMWRLFADVKTEGIGPDPVEEILFYGKNEDGIGKNLLLTEQGGYYKLFPMEVEDKWFEAGPEERALFDEIRQTIARDPEAWTVIRQPGASEPFEIRWKKSRTRLIDLESTGDADDRVTRFAHDAPLSASFGDKHIYAGTRGGVVYFGRPASSEGSPGESFRIDSEEVLSEQELRGSTKPSGIGFIRYGNPDGTLYAKREGDGNVAKNSGSGWRIVSDSDAGFRQLSAVAQDSIWSWEKDSTAPVRLVPKSPLKAPPGYTYIENGTWSFLETGSTRPEDPHESMKYYKGRLYVATLGGVARFSVPEEGEEQTARPSVEPGFIDSVYAVAREDGVEIEMEDIAELVFVERLDQLFAVDKNGDRYLYRPDQEVWEAYDGPVDPQKESVEVANDDLFVWRAKEQGGFDVTVTPLATDMADHSEYGLFSNGRFSFDEVNAFCKLGDRLWLATEGGVCRYSYEEFKVERFFAEAFKKSGDESGEEGRLAGVREIVEHPDEPLRLVTRTARGILYEKPEGSDSFMPIQGKTPSGSDAESIFERAYTREQPSGGNRQTRWVQYPFRSAPHPEGAVLVERKTACGRTVILGPDDTGSDLPLISRNRFSFDDVRSITLDDSDLLAATPAGIARYRIDWPEQRVRFDSMQCCSADPAPADGVTVMKGLERIRRFQNGSVKAWGGEHVHDLIESAEDNSVRWKVNPSMNAETMEKEIELADREHSWKLNAYQKKKPMRVERIVGGKIAASEEIHARFKPIDVSNSVMDGNWIYVPDPKGGIIRIRKSDIGKQGG